MTKILLIEDDPMMQRLYQRAFSLSGIEIASAQDGEEGLEKIKRLNPNLILLDIMMPKVNGMQILNVIKKDGKTKNIPVLMLTNVASGTLESAKEAVEKGGADNYIIKSDCEPNEVVKISLNLLKKHGLEG